MRSINPFQVPQDWRKPMDENQRIVMWTGYQFAWWAGLFVWNVHSLVRQFSNDEPYWWVMIPVVLISVGGIFFSRWNMKVRLNAMKEFIQMDTIQELIQAAIDKQDKLDFDPDDFWDINDKKGAR